jgi:hypothetical protein
MAQEQNRNSMQSIVMLSILLTSFVIYGCHRKSVDIVEGPTTGVKLADNTNWLDEQCTACHGVHSFNGDHAEFSERFPYTRRNTIYFNHSRHFKKHFVKKSKAKSSRGKKGKSKKSRGRRRKSKSKSKSKSKDKDKASAKPAFTLKTNAPKGCVNCHDPDKPELITQSQAAFETNCGKCHSKQIRRTELVMLARDDSTAFMKYLLNTSENTKPRTIRALFSRIAKKGKSALVDKLTERTKNKKQAENMLANLDDELIKKVSKQWAQNKDVDDAKAPEKGGWYTKRQELHYSPTGHADPVVRAWLEFSPQSTVRPTDKNLFGHGVDLRNALLSRDSGMGRCIRCHSVSFDKVDNDIDKAHEVEWQRPMKQTGRQVTFFNHAVHTDPGKKDRNANCKSCHAINKSANYDEAFKTLGSIDFESNFQTINKKTCSKCHGTKEVKQNCLQCHVNHRVRDVRALMSKTAPRAQ